MFHGGKTSIPKPASRNLEDLDSVQRVLLHRSVRAPGMQPGWAQKRDSVRCRAPLPESVRRCPGSLRLQPRASRLPEAPPLFEEGKGPCEAKLSLKALCAFCAGPGMGVLGEGES